MAVEITPPDQDFVLAQPPTGLFQRAWKATQPWVKDVVALFPERKSTRLKREAIEAVLRERRQAEVRRLDEQMAQEGSELRQATLAYIQTHPELWHLNGHPEG